MHEGVRTNFVYDGENLIYLNGSGIKSEGEGSARQISMSRYMASGVDLATLHALTENMLIDKNNIYIGQHELQTIPIKKLGFGVKVFASVAEMEE